MGEIMTTTYTFSVSLFDASANPNGLQVWQSGTLTLDTASNTGALALPDFYQDPIPYEGSTVSPATLAGTIIEASGKSAEAQITFTVTYNFDGFLYNGSYVGGLISVLDYAAQETYLYVIQGLSAQSPWGASVRGGSTAADKRTPRTA
jgi:hypothetical protein